MSSMKLLGVSCGALIVFVALTRSPPSKLEADVRKLTVRESPDRIVLVWNGQVAEPMRDEIAAAIGRYKEDPRRLILTLNSPGGSIGHGHEVMTAIRHGAYSRQIDTHVEKGASCVSMCVPIFLLGANRTAHPDAYFKFHEASLVLKPGSPPGKQKAVVVDSTYRKKIETIVTDKMYEGDIGGQRVNSAWLREMRAKIVGKDIWLTAQQLVDARSGVVDALPTMSLAQQK